MWKPMEWLGSEKMVAVRPEQFLSLYFKNKIIICYFLLMLYPHLSNPCGSKIFMHRARPSKLAGNLVCMHALHLHSIIWYPKKKNVGKR